MASRTIPGAAPRGRRAAEVREDPIAGRVRGKARDPRRGPPRSDAPEAADPAEGPARSAPRPSPVGLAVRVRFAGSVRARPPRAEGRVLCSASLRSTRRPPPYGRATGHVARIAEGAPPRPAHVDSERELSHEIDKAAAKLDPTNEWTDRIAAMVRVEALLWLGARRSGSPSRRTWRSFARRSPRRWRTDAAPSCARRRTCW